MSFRIICAIALCAPLCAHAMEVREGQKQKTEEAREGQTRRTLIIIHGMKTPEDKARLLAVAHQLGATVIYDLKQVSALVIQLPDHPSTERAIAHFKGMDGVFSVERDSIVNTERHHQGIHHQRGIPLCLH